MKRFSFFLVLASLCLSVKADVLPITNGLIPAATAKLQASDGATNDLFGSVVQLSNDTAVIGAAGKTLGSVFLGGAVYIYKNLNGAWVQQAKLTAPDPGIADYFGNAISLDGNTLAIGAYNKTVDGISSQGAVYIYVNTAGNWTLQTKLTIPDSTGFEQFGTSVALVGNSLYVGAPGSGVVYKFVRTGNSWGTFVNALFTNTGIAGFGTFLVANDRFIVAGSNNDPSVYIYNLTGILQQVVTASSNPSSLTLNDYTLVIGSNATNSLTVFTKSTTWTQQAKLKAPDALVNLGSSVALEGDLLIAGNYSPFIGSVSPAANYVFSRSGDGSWSQVSKLLPSDYAQGDGFGFAVGVSGNSFISGALYSNGPSLPLQGAAYISSLILRASGPTEYWSSAFHNTTSGPGRGTFFADITGDSRADAIVVNDNGIFVRPSTGVEFTNQAVWAGSPFYGTRGTFFTDVTGDGKADFVVVNNNGITVRRSNGFGTGFNENWSGGPYYGSRGTFFADVNGDSRADAIAVNDEGIYVRLSTGNSFGATEFWSNPFYNLSSGNGFGTYFADVDGDKKADAVVVSDDSIYVKRSFGNLFGPVENWTGTPFFGSKGTFFADLTGDSRADAISVTDAGILLRRANACAPNTTTASVAANSCNPGFASAESWSEPFYGSEGEQFVYFADVDGQALGNQKSVDAVVVNSGGISVKRSPVQ